MDFECQLKPLKLINNQQMHKQHKLCWDFGTEKSLTNLMSERISNAMCLLSVVLVSIDIQLVGYTHIYKMSYN